MLTEFARGLRKRLTEYEKEQTQEDEDEDEEEDGGSNASDEEETKRRENVEVEDEGNDDDHETSESDDKPITKLSTKIMPSVLQDSDSDKTGSGEDEIDVLGNREFKQATPMSVKTSRSASSLSTKKKSGKKTKKKKHKKKEKGKSKDLSDNEEVGKKKMMKGISRKGVDFYFANSNYIILI